MTTAKNAAHFPPGKHDYSGLTVGEPAKSPLVWVPLPIVLGVSLGWLVFSPYSYASSLQILMP